MQKMQKHNELVLAGTVAACVTILVSRLVDLALFTDPQTSFVTIGPAWTRYAVPAVLAVLMDQFSHMGAVAHPAALRGKCGRLGGWLLAAGAAFALGGLLAVPSLFTAYGINLVVAVLDCVLPVVLAMGLVLFGLRALSPENGAEPLPHFATALLPVGYLIWAAIRLFFVAPASVLRLSCTMRVLSVCGALMFTIALLRVFLAPRQPYGESLYASGMAAFLLCTCCELPQAVFELFWGTGTIHGFVLSLGMGLYGVCGLVCGIAAAGKEAPEE